MSLVYLGKATPEGGGGSSPVIESLSITPTTSQQTITATTGTDGYSPITVAAVTAAIDANIVAGNIKKDVTILDVVGTYEGSTPSGKYKILDRVKDDNNVEIGTVSGFFTDANDTEYAVVCLDAQYRLASGKYLDSNILVTDLPQYADLSLWSATDTATWNTEIILTFCAANNHTSTACTHCRSKSFTIDGITYEGQLPNICELTDIIRQRIEINSADPGASSYSSLFIPTAVSIWSSSQFSSNTGWGFSQAGEVTYKNKSFNAFVIPVLEIPNAI